MGLSRLSTATRALVAVLLVLARSYLVVLEVNRDSSPEKVLKAYRKVILKVPPDKGGKKADAQKLQKAKEAWDKVRKGTETENASTGGSLAVVVQRKEQRKEFMVNAQVVLGNSDNRVVVERQGAAASGEAAANTANLF